MRLIEELGLSGEIVPSSKAAANRFLLRKGRLRSLGYFWPRRVWAGAREVFRKKGSGEDESIYAFAARRFGATVARRFFDPLTLGIYAGDIHRLSVRSCFRPFWEWEQKEGSVVRGMLKKKRGEPGLFTLKGGLERLISELERQLPIRVVKNCYVEAFSSGVETSQGVFLADRMISALPANEISRLTGIELAIPYRSIWVVHLGFGARVLKKRGFGYLVPSEEGERLLGMVWDSEIFGEEKQTRLTAMVREESMDPVGDALGALKRHLEIEQRPDYVTYQLAEKAIPQFEVGHEEKMAHFEREAAKRFPHLSLVGNYWAGASLEACVARARLVV
ncbi:MAG TPA: protoporphyrinogen oxidase [Parachlamydiales bacterium]|nr:protoporphyrinogen oxidase [Parachlamydiales bacterium]